MIDQITIDRILDAAQIMDVVSDFVTLRKRGVNYVGLCPFHSDKTPSFYVSPAKGLCKCFACGKGVFFFKQKTAYELRESDWSSDVCSSDLNVNETAGLPRRCFYLSTISRQFCRCCFPRR